MNKLPTIEAVALDDVTGGRLVFGPRYYGGINPLLVAAAAGVPVAAVAPYYVARPVFGFRRWR